MTDSRDQSYYEIALTNRQVVGIFVVLLVCVVVAFLSGVWIGRGGGPRVATAEARAIEAGFEPGEEPLEELEFFNRDEPEAPGSPTASPEEPTAGPQATAEIPVIIEEREAASAPASEAPPPAAGVEPAAAVQAETAEPSAVDGPVVVQVFSTNDADQARQVLARLEAAGYPAQLSPVDVEGRTMYRVRVGPYDDRDEAQGVADRVRRDFRLDTWITR